MVRFDDAVRNAPGFIQTAEAITAGRAPVLMSGVCEGIKPALAAALAESRPVLVVAPGDMAGTRLYEDLSQLLGADSVAYFPPYDVTFYHYGAQSRESITRRLEALHRAISGSVSVLVAPIEALLPGIQPPEAFSSGVISLIRGKAFDPFKLLESLVAAGYERVDMVEARGQMSARGGLLDIYPIGDTLPVRVEFFDDEVDSIRSFDPVTQRSIENLMEVSIPPATAAVVDEAAMQRAAELIRKELVGKAPAPVPRGMPTDDSDELPELWDMPDSEPAPLPLPEPEAARKQQIAAHEHESLLRRGTRFEAVEQYLPYCFERLATPLSYLKNAVVILDDPARCEERATNVLLEFAETFRSALERGDALPGQGRLMRDYDGLLSELLDAPLLAFSGLLGQPRGFKPKTLVSLDSRSAPGCQGRMDTLVSDIKGLLERDYGVVLLSGGVARSQRLVDTLREHGIEAVTAERPALPGEAVALAVSQGHGYVLPSAKLAVFGEIEIFGGARERLRPQRKATAGQRIASFTDLHIGDAVVHEKHGVGIYMGTIKIEIDGTYRDYLHLRYLGEDKLYVPTDQMDRVQKYICGGDDIKPKLNKLGGSEWQRAKAKAKKSIRDMADDLVRLYAERQAAGGFAFTPDTPWQREFEDFFPYEETADQLRAVRDIKRDMERQTSMDRLLCGDVGYGKTEVAVRAAFKAVLDKKQVAILVPTTILAQQHYQTLRKRFENFPAKIEVLSRFRTPQEQKKVIELLRMGEVDILIGTHRLLGKDVRFKDIGLLVIDEEQRFGVQHKEQLKKIKAGVDTLTLSATPIPRTLHMSMVGIRDMSLLEKPPDERYPVQTFVLEYSDSLIRDAILREIQRGGQVYFVYNRVETIDRMHEQLRRVVPEARIVVGHGQMKETALEDVMLDFFEGRFDVLLCSTIIESGLDVAAANTMIVYDADYFGLSQLYQLRGRVGRSNRLAYCYLTVRPNKVISETAEKRLNAIREFTEFGSGFKIAMRDLEIRGAGNILGGEQHGHLSAVGYDLYCKMIEEAVREIRGDAGLGLDVETTVECKVDAFLPSDYVRGDVLRMDVYKRISAIDSVEDRDDCVEELTDRFGDLPAPVDNLVAIAYMKALCGKLQIELASCKGAQLQLRFHEKAQPDPIALMAALNAMQGKVTLSATVPPSLYIRMKDAPHEQLIREGAQTLEAMLAFIENKAE